MARVIVISAEPLAHLHSGYHQYTAQWFNQLAQDHELHSVVLRGGPPGAESGGDQWDVHCVSHRGESQKKLRQIQSLFSRRTMFENSMNFPGCVDGVNALVRSLRPDLVILNHLRAGWVLRHWNRPACPVAYIAHDCESDAYLSISQMGFSWPVKMALRWDAAKLRRLESEVFANIDGCITLSEDDVQRCQALVPGVRCHVVPPIRELPSPKPAQVASAGSDQENILLMGCFAWAPKRTNALWLANEVLPLVRVHRPRAVLRIVGRAADRLEKRLKDRPDVEIHADVPSIEPYYRDARIAVVPEAQASGVKFKTLEAASYGLAIVSTPYGREGTGLADGTQCLVAKSAAEFATQIVKLLENPALRRDMGTSARAEIERRFSRARVAEKMTEVTDSLLGTAVQATTDSRLLTPTTIGT
jgi:glycosyltransferase involved in cell wall biosynthesis